MSRALRILLAVVLVGLIVAVALWIVGGKSTRYSTSLVINAPPADVFKYLTDRELMKKWVEGLVSIEPLDDSPIQVGARARITMESGGKQKEFDEEIIRYEQDKQLSAKATNSLLTWTSIYRLESKEEGQTSLTFVVKQSSRGLGKFIRPFMSSSVEEKLMSDAQRLKELVESEPAQTQQGN